MANKTRWTLVVSAVALAVLAAGPAAQAYWQGDEKVPSPAYQTDPGLPLIYANGIMAKNTVFTATSDRALANPGGPFTIDSFFDIFTEVSTDGGGTWMPMTASNVLAQIAYMPTVLGVQDYDAEVLLLNGNLPVGVMIRESPTRASRGRTTIASLGVADYDCDSFFDIFTEISLDGGQSWAPSQAPLHLMGTPEPATLSLLAVGGALLAWRRRK